MAKDYMYTWPLISCYDLDLRFAFGFIEVDMCLKYFAPRGLMQRRNTKTTLFKNSIQGFRDIKG